MVSEDRRERLIIFVELWAMFLVILVTVIIGLAIMDHWNNEAKKAALVSRAQNSQFQLFLANQRKEKVCSETNQGQACVALFERLVNNVTNEQRNRLACLIASDLKKPELADEIDCTGIIRK